MADAREMVTIEWLNELTAPAEVAYYLLNDSYVVIAKNVEKDFYIIIDTLSRKAKYGVRVVIKNSLNIFDTKHKDLSSLYKYPKDDVYNILKNVVYNFEVDETARDVACIDTDELIEWFIETIRNYKTTVVKSIDTFKKMHNKLVESTCNVSRAISVENMLFSYITKLHNDKYYNIVDCIYDGLRYCIQFVLTADNKVELAAYVRDATTNMPKVYVLTSEDLNGFKNEIKKLPKYVNDGLCKLLCTNVLNDDLLYYIKSTYATDNMIKYINEYNIKANEDSDFAEYRITYNYCNTSKLLSYVAKLLTEFYASYGCLIEFMNER